MNYDTLILFIASTAVLAISPGPDNIYVLIQSIVNGKFFGLVTVYGLISGCIVHTTLLAFGVSVIIKTNKNLFFVIKLFGVIYLLYLAYKVYKSNVQLYLNDQTVSQKNIKNLFIQGFFMNVLNPKVTIFFLAFFPGFLFSETISSVTQFYILGSIFMLVSFVIFSAIALLAARVKTYIANHKNSLRVLKWLQILVYIGIAVFILM